MYARVWSQDYNARCVCAHPTAPRPETRVLRVETGECGWLGADVYIYIYIQGRRRVAGRRVVSAPLSASKRSLRHLFIIIIFFNCSYFPSSSSRAASTILYIPIYMYIYELARTRGEVCAPPSDRSESQLPQSLVYVYIYIHIYTHNIYVTYIRITLSPRRRSPAHCTRTPSPLHCLHINYPQICVSTTVGLCVSTAVCP